MRKLLLVTPLLVSFASLGQAPARQNVWDLCMAHEFSICRKSQPRQVMEVIEPGSNEVSQTCLSSYMQKQYVETCVQKVGSYCSTFTQGEELPPGCGNQQ